MVEELMAVGAVSGVIATITFGLAGYETFRLASCDANQSLVGNCLQAVWQSTVEEPVPAQLTDLVEQLGGDNDGIRSQ
jgi:hypothetical protein